MTRLVPFASGRNRFTTIKFTKPITGISKSKVLVERAPLEHEVGLSHRARVAQFGLPLPSSMGFHRISEKSGGVVVAQTIGKYRGYRFLGLSTSVTF